MEGIAMKKGIKEFQLICGDNIEKMNVLPDDSLHCIITSPPYFNAREYSYYESYETYLRYLKNVFSLAFRKLKENRMCCVNLSNVLVPRLKRSAASKRIPIPFHFVGLMEGIGFEFIDDIIWVKPEGAALNRNGGFFQHQLPVAYKPNIVNEYILIFKKPSLKLIDHVLKQYDEKTKDESRVAGEYERSNVWQINPETSNPHPAPFPLELTDRLVQYYTFKGDTVLDMFMGSGTTGVSCLKKQRKFIGIEKEQEYYDFALQRIANTAVEV